MADIQKASSGILYQEDFSDGLSLLWDLCPNITDRVTINSDSISLLAGTQRMELLIPTPKENGYVFQANIDYRPSAPTERAGVILKSTNESLVELEVCGDDEIVCNSIKIELDNNFTLNAKALSNSLWLDYGNSKVIDSNKIGFFINEATSVDSLNIKNCAFFKDNFIYVNGIDNMLKLELYDANDTEITDQFKITKLDKRTIIDGTHSIFPIKEFIIKLRDSSGSIVYTKAFSDLCGGDVYEYTHNVKMMIDEITLTDSEHNLGSVNSNTIYKLTITNDEIFKVENKTLKVSRYSPYNFGYEDVAICKVKNGQPTGEYSKEIIEVSLEPAESREFSLMIERNSEATAPTVDNNFKFKISFD